MAAGGKIEGGEKESGKKEGRGGRRPEAADRWRGVGAWVRVEAVCNPGLDIVFMCGEQLQVIWVPRAHTHRHTRAHTRTHTPSRTPTRTPTPTHTQAHARSTHERAHTRAHYDVRNVCLSASLLTNKLKCQQTC